MKHGLLYECPRSLVESWWILLAEHGFTVETRPAANMEILPERDGVRYRCGSVRRGAATIEIIGCPGPYPPSQSPLAGKHFLLVDFRKSSRLDVELARAVGDLLLQFGA